MTPLIRSLLVVAAVVAPLAGARAAPQILGLVATNAPVALTCADGVCTAELSAFCLERERSVPAPGTAYVAVDAERITLVATAADGSIRQIPAADVLRVNAARGYAAVRVEIPEMVREALGAVRLAVQVGRAVTLAPVPVAGDPEPHTRADIANAAGPLRDLATATVDQGGKYTDGARVINRIVNALPTGRASAAAQRQAWARAVGGPLDMLSADSGRARGAFALLACRQSVSSGQAESVRRCLQYRHDALMSFQNVKYWEASKLGM